MGRCGLSITGVGSLAENQAMFTSWGFPRMKKIKGCIISRSPWNKSVRRALGPILQMKALRLSLSGGHTAHGCVVSHSGWHLP